MPRFLQPSRPPLLLMLLLRYTVLTANKQIARLLFSCPLRTARVSLGTTGTTFFGGWVKIKLKLPHFHVSYTRFDLTHPPVATTARAAATGPVSMLTRPDPEGSETVEIATRRCPRLRVVWDLLCVQLLQQYICEQFMGLKRRKLSVLDSLQALKGNKKTCCCWVSEYVFMECRYCY